jgi:hypothetical protein
VCKVFEIDELDLDFSPTSEEMMGIGWGALIKQELISG